MRSFERIICLFIKIGAFHFYTHFQLLFQFSWVGFYPVGASQCRDVDGASQANVIVWLALHTYTVHSERVDVITRIK